VEEELVQTLGLVPPVVVLVAVPLPLAFHLHEMIMVAGTLMAQTY